MTDFPALAPEFIDYPTLDRLEPISFDHPPRFLLLYGSLRERSFTRGRADYLVDRYSERKAEGRSPAASILADTLK